VALVAPNSTEWIVTDLAAQAVGAVSVGIDPDQPVDVVLTQLDHSEASIVAAEPGAVLDAIAAARPRLRWLRRIIVMGRDPGQPAERADDPTFVSWSVIERREASIDELERAAATLDLDRVAALLYTPGDHRRAVMLSHHNLVSVGEQAMRSFGLDPTTDTGPTRSLALAGQRAIVAGALRSGASILLARSADTPLPSVAVDVASGWVARRADEVAHVLTRPMRRWALATLVGAARRARAGSPATFDATLSAIAGRIYRRGARARAGVRGVSSAIALGPLPAEVVEHWWALGVPLREAYGLTEAAGLVAVVPAGTERAGTAGRPVPRAHLRIAVDGEVLVRGPQVFVGYFKDEAGSRHAVDPDGWLRTGDVGRLDRDGSLVVTGRLSSLVTTADGQRFSPEQLETRLLASPFIARALVAMSTRDDLVALVEPSRPVVAAWRGTADRDDRDDRAEAVLLTREAVTALQGSAPAIGRVVVASGGFARDAGDVGADGVIRRGHARRRWSHAIDLR
jgi:long-chain acyl-CoA synthetase